MAQQFTPWQKMVAYRKNHQKLLNYWTDKEKRNPTIVPRDKEYIYGDPLYPPPKMTLYNNLKENVCSKIKCKTAYDYNFTYSEGYDQRRHRDDRKHPVLYMNIDLEEQYPYTKVPLLGSSNYGHRPTKLETTCPKGRLKATKCFYRNSGVKYCLCRTDIKQQRLRSIWGFHYIDQD